MGVWARGVERGAFCGAPAQALVPAVVGLWLAARLAWAIPGVPADPRAFYGVDPRAHETSLWLSEHLGPGESHALPFESTYSTWDGPRPELDPRWFIWFGIPSSDLLCFMRQLGINKVVIDMADSGLSGYADELGAAPGDAQGPLAFLGWPRCFPTAIVRADSSSAVAPDGSAVVHCRSATASG